ncbi:MAG: methylated-DNA--[protein]-cysteine S-methyltransferase [Candidatus Latescibacterota bacterium]|nr:MAG: methylated-DNA--[protein]-cysteine S-methyltransferase [Candidatus Latescibacterota bacterium]
MNDRDFSQQAEDYRRIEQAIRFVEANFRSQPTLDEIAKSAHLSKFHFHRLFKRWVGISPVQFMQYLTLEYSKRRLAECASLLDTSLDAGLSGPSRLHDLFVTFDAMTPGEFKVLGAGLKIGYGFHPTPFGECLLATTRRGICHLGFVDDGKRQATLDQLEQEWPEALVVEDNTNTGSIVNRIFASEKTKATVPFHLLLKGTNFQVNVWRALLAIPRGSVVSYQDIAAHIGHPKSFRAVAGAIALNPVSYLIPCHRVIAKSGETHRYRWGSARKKAILGWEAAGIG